mgnify:CR=1 FL=1
MSVKYNDLGVEFLKACKHLHSERAFDIHCGYYERESTKSSFAKSTKIKAHLCFPEPFIVNKINRQTYRLKIEERCDHKQYGQRARAAGTLLDLHQATG